MLREGEEESRGRCELSLNPNLESRECFERRVTTLALACPPSSSAPLDAATAPGSITTKRRSSRVRLRQTDISLVSLFQLLLPTTPLHHSLARSRPRLVGSMMLRAESVLIVKAAFCALPGSTACAVCVGDFVPHDLLQSSVPHHFVSKFLRLQSSSLAFCSHSQVSQRRLHSS